MQGAPLLHPNGLLFAVDRTGDRPRVAVLLTRATSRTGRRVGWREGYIDQLGVLWRGARLTLRRCAVPRCGRRSATWISTGHRRQFCQPHGLRRSP